MGKFTIAESSKLKMFPKIEQHPFENILSSMNIFLMAYVKSKQGYYLNHHCSLHS